MDADSFDRLSTYITREYGIKLPSSKKSMLESRLNKKIKELAMTTYKEFLDYIFSSNGSEHLVDVVDLITTNKTDFFREPHHFKFLTEQFLPKYFKNSGRSNLKVWSAGCSTGEEPYTLMMVLEEYKKRQQDITYTIMASDISMRVIQAAYQGIYPLNIMSTISPELKQNYFLKSKTNPNIARVKPQYRKKISYRNINLMEETLAAPKDYDIIFCRNVLIYFDKPTQEKLLKKFCTHLRPGALLFLGHSESIMGMDLPLTQVGLTIYQVTQ